MPLPHVKGIAMTARKRAEKSTLRLSIFPGNLGWMALVTAGEIVRQLTFGHSSPSAAKRGIEPELLAAAEIVESETPLTRRLRAYASGNPDSFRDVAVDLGRLSRFGRRVLKECRRIALGSTISYAELASQAGFPRAARAVGNLLAANRVPLIIPCHRVVRSDGGLGSYSAGGGPTMKRRLLALESRKLA